MNKRTWIILINIAAFLFLMLSVSTMVSEITDFFNIAIPSAILFITNLVCLGKLTK